MTTCYGVHFDPFDANRLFISYTDIGMWRSDDRGTSWTTCDVPRDWRNTTYWIAFDPEVKGRGWAVMSSVHDLPRPKMFRSRDVGGYNGGVTDNRGRRQDLDEDDAGHAAHRGDAHHPRSHEPEGCALLYVTGFGTGVWKSADGGKSWR